MSSTSLPDRWRERAAELEPYAAPAAEAFRRAAAEFEAWLAEQDDLLMTPAEVAAAGGCSAESVRRAVRDGTVENMGGPGNIQVRKADTGKLPKGRGRKSKRSSYGAVSRRVALTSIQGDLT